jgi:type IV pilus assembly protein PilM
MVTGIDLGHGAVKLVRLDNGGLGEHQLTHWGVEELPPGSEDMVEDRAKALLRLLKRLGLGPRQLGRTATAVGGRGVHLRQVSMPRLSPEDLRRALPYEAKKHLPIENLVQPCLDFQILNGRPTDEEASTQEVLLVASPRDWRDQALEVLDRAGIHPDILDAQPLPSVNAVLTAYPPPDDSGWMVVLDMGADASVLAAVLPDGSFYSRPLEFTGDRLTRAIEEEFGLDQPAAEIVKRELGSPESGQGLALVDHKVQGLIGELFETLRFLQIRKRSQTLGGIYLCGGGTLLYGLREKLSEAMQVDVIQADPFQGFSPESRRPGPAETPWLVGALGLAQWWQ